jgi:hypothetical protein
MFRMLYSIKFIRKHINLMDKTSIQVYILLDESQTRAFLRL